MDQVKAVPSFCLSGRCTFPYSFLYPLLGWHRDPDSLHGIQWNFALFGVIQCLKIDPGFYSILPSSAWYGEVPGFSSNWSSATMVVIGESSLQISLWFLRWSYSGYEVGKGNGKCTQCYIPQGLTMIEIDICHRNQYLFYIIIWIFHSRTSGSQRTYWMHKCSEKST